MSSTRPRICSRSVAQRSELGAGAFGLGEARARGIELGSTRSRRARACLRVRGELVVARALSARVRSSTGDQHA